MYQVTPSLLGWRSCVWCLVLNIKSSCYLDLAQWWSICLLCIRSASPGSTPGKNSYLKPWRTTAVIVDNTELGGPIVWLSIKQLPVFLITSSHIWNKTSIWCFISPQEPERPFIDSSNNSLWNARNHIYFSSCSPAELCPWFYRGPNCLSELFFIVT